MKLFPSVSSTPSVAGSDGGSIAKTKIRNSQRDQNKRTYTTTNQSLECIDRNAGIMSPPKSNRV